MTKGETYVTDDGMRIDVTRVAADHSWADITVTQRGGASWNKRQPLQDGELPYKAHNLSIWEGDGLPDYDDWTYLADDSLGMTMSELRGWLDSCKREAWVHEKCAKHEDPERNLAIARYFWRRHEKLKSYIDKLESELDEDHRTAASD